MASVRLKNVKKIYENKVVAVHDFNLDIADKEFIVFVGPSGCGKSTTLRMIAGLEEISEGKIEIDGVVVNDLQPKDRGVAMVFQNYALYPHLTVYENMAFSLRLQKMSNDEIYKRVTAAAETLGILEFLLRKPRALSGGQRQRVAIGRAMVRDSKVFLMDEPLSNLDAKLRNQMRAEIILLRKKIDTTFIYVTHDQEEALTMSDKIVVMSEGRIQQVGTPEDIYNEPKNAFVADFIGESNIFNGIMTGKCRVRFCGAEFTCVDDVEHGTMIDAVVRPEDVIITAPDKGIIRGTVTSVIFKGVHYEIVVVSGKNEIVVQSTKKAELNAEVGINIEPEGIHIMIAENTINRIESGVDKDYRLLFMDGELACDITSLMPGTSFNAEGEIVDAHGDVIEPEKIKVIVSVKPEDITMSDDKEKGILRGHIINLIYKGDHYGYVVRTDDDEDFIVDDEDLWNMDDYVSLVIPDDKFSFALKK